MFTGIVKDLGTVQSKKNGQITVRTGLKDVREGDSVMVNGVCLTASAVHPGGLTMDIGYETARATSLGNLRTGSKVNLEDALTLTSKVGGHIVYGHITDVGKVISIRRAGNTLLIRIRAGRDFVSGLVEKGSVAVSGVSLTVNRKEKDFFEVGIIPETACRTTLGNVRVSDRVNLEPDFMIISRK